MLLSFFLVLAAILSSVAVFIGNFSSKLEQELGNRALAIARTVAQIPEIQYYIGQRDGYMLIQPIAERIRLSTQTEYIVILDMDKKRFSHPLQERIGQAFEGKDGEPAFESEEVVSRATGVAGQSVRAFSPIYIDEGTTQVGVVLVGILSPSLVELLGAIGSDISFSLMAGLLAGIAGSFLLAKNIKKIMFDLEPSEIAHMLEERTAVFHSIEEGLIAINAENQISVMNNMAKRIFGVRENALGKDITEVIPGSWLPMTAKTGIPEYNQVRTINNTTILVNRIPIWVRGQVVGAVSTFRDKTEVYRLAEELTGVKDFIDALRVQNHETINKLHTIAGLIQLDKEEEALDFIFKEIEKQQEITSFLTENIKDYSVAGLILGKYNRAQELKVNFVIDRNSRLHRLPRNLDSSALIIIIGNILENAFDAVIAKPQADRQVTFSIRDEDEKDKLILDVQDTGKGIDPSIRSEIFKKGFTTKNKSGHGLGLPLVKTYVDNSGGIIRLNSRQDKGTRIIIEVPL